MAGGAAELPKWQTKYSRFFFVDYSSSDCRIPIYLVGRKENA